jgi:UDP-2,4-diacetamido-2,4,6-trideoxy-beta-L-altropyranose hydrolase
MRLLFILLADQHVGFGHLNRCLSIAECALTRGIEVAFFVLGTGADIIRGRGHLAVEAPWPGHFTEELIYEDIGKTIAIIDVAHPMAFSNQSDLTFLFTTARMLADKLVAVDSLGNFSFAVQMPLIPVDVVLIPYVGGVEIPDNSATMLVGPKYALLNPKYASVQMRKIKEAAERILVTFGGADQQELTLIVLEALNQINQKLALRIVIGPLFSKDLITLIKFQSAKLNHYVELVFSPHSLVEHMLWADLAVSASGLVKYELAATGTPGVIISINGEHDRVNRSFAQEGLHRDLGVTADPVLIGQEINALICNFDDRRIMAERGQQLVDGKGVERLIANLLNFGNSCRVNK